MSPSPESFSDTGKSRGWGIVTGTQRFWFSVLSVFSFNIWLLVWPRGLAVALSSSLPDKPHPCPKGRVHRDPEPVLLFLQCLSTQTEFLDQALSYFSGEGGGFTSFTHSLEALRFHFTSAADCSLTFAASLYANLSHCKTPGNATTEQNTQVRRELGDH